MNIDKGIALGKEPTGVETVVLSEQLKRDHTMYSALAPAQQRKTLARMEKTVPLRKMTYTQAKLYHKLKGRIGK